MRLDVPTTNARVAAVKQTSPSAMRNREPILAVLRNVLPERGTVLEIASGTGEHVLHFAAALPSLVFQPSDASAAALESVAAHLRETPLGNVRAPVRVDVTEQDWSVQHADAVLCCNMIHIAPWQACEGLMRGAGRVLGLGAPLVTYGPYRFHGEFTAPSNADFDASLRQRDPSWGVRDVDDIFACAEASGLSHERTVVMPANNHMLVFRRQQ